ncbi:MAG: divalent metal cation transporter [Candidatus Eremiobacteraeota bacterium]|nr:divalent metal cation transporter [Candidatus Eremiobacteraeota bacterium]MBV9056210.1 divalent metal cation transporter [Candidatus Eremiobacteraeota bacterium]MBV9700108.1 divalent metal cation transporter [Candidatus Eremiobacteraeota bacterium]
MKSIVRFFRILGPGLITGAADDDPSGISTYSVAGAATGFSMLWLTLVSTPMMAVIQGMCARISMVNGEGIAAIMRKRLPLWLAYGLAGLVIVANTFNLGADIGGMADAAHLLVPVPVDAFVFFFGIGLIAAQIWLPYARIARIFKWLTLALFAYVITAFVVRPPWGQVLLNFAVPRLRFDSGWLSTMVGVLGTTITPYLFFWQSSLMVEEEKEAGRTSIAERRGTDERSVKTMHADVNTGMIFSNVVAFFIIVTTAATLGAHGKHDISTAQQAAEALRPLAGRFAELLFTLGMVGTGFLAVPVLATSSAYVAAQTFKFREGLSEPLHRAPRFYGIIVAGMLLGIGMNLLKIDAIRALFWAAILNGIAAVPLIALIVWLASSRKVMGEWVSSLAARAWGWATVALMGGATVAMFYFMAHPS